MKLVHYPQLCPWFPFFSGVSTEVLASLGDLHRGQMLDAFVTKESDLMHEELRSLLGLIYHFLFGVGLLPLSLCTS